MVMAENTNIEKKDFDIDYILQHCDQSKHNIPGSFDKIPWKVGETYKIRVGNIYDPSKFWIVYHEKEVNVFHRFINDFYNRRKDDYRMPNQAIIRNRYCVVFTDKAFYRGIIVNIPHFTDRRTKVVVFLFDFGFTSVVTIDNLFYLYEKMYNIQRFAIRACLNGIEPVNSESWSKDAVKKFNELAVGKVLLCVLDSIDVELKVVHIRIGEVAAISQFKEVSQILVEEKLAKMSTGKRSRSKPQGKLVSKVKYPFLFPSHEAIETGLVPSAHYVAEEIKHCPLAASLLYKPYYSENRGG